MFGFGIPFNSTNNADEMRALKQYIDYIVARYGAYVSMWEIANEAYVNDDLLHSLVEYVKLIDYEKRPVATSWEHPEHQYIDVASPHWYLSTYVADTDTQLIDQINKFTPYAKPILFGEIGETEKNWSVHSALQMRVRSWVAFFNEAILVFWNQSENRNYYNSLFKNANQYIGPEERLYIYNLQQFTSSVALDAAPVAIHTSNSSVRSYGLQSGRELLGYFFHYEAPYTQTFITMGVVVPRPSTISWCDPTTGKTLQSYRIAQGGSTLTSPAFTSDLALKIVFDPQ
jgi:hypothetical protein